MDYTPIGYWLIPLNRKDWLWRINESVLSIWIQYMNLESQYLVRTHTMVFAWNLQIYNPSTICTHILLLQQYMYSPSKNDVTYNFLPIKSLHLFIPFYLWFVPWIDKTITRYMFGFFPPVIDSLARSQNATYLFIF